MSKFEELCSAYKNFRDQLSDTRHNAYSMAHRIAYNYRKYLELDNDAVLKLIPLDRPVQSGTMYTPAGATHLGEDGFWHLGVELTVYMGANIHPQQTFTISFKFIKNEDGSHLLDVDDLNASTIISDVNNATEFNPVFDKIHENIIGYFNENLEFLKGKHNKMSSIGFIQNSIATTINSENNG
ncbi:hypothetical protein ACHHZ2_17480 [Citrobacter freundii complex sp. 2024EL-00237]|uniref:hypothetical protein n=1 Tax=Enterobacteriaceae TaxID=543 RepID=UPI000D909625|nr:MULTISPECIES: hypothetical protein [Enterobacteriaceae]MDH0216273.1 hypothetical protein [Citrobacter freundii]MDH0228090.1 hypothetical protein [Citrobacter freundii]MDH0242029.1 hypothetical protein [Citrobacter freundii]MDH0982125.1 hypothetical protein [Citrobacter freundii]MDH1347436.1 hypothetical protein [Citrobacter freundii]